MESIDMLNTLTKEQAKDVQEEYVRQIIQIIGAMREIELNTQVSVYVGDICDLITYVGYGHPDWDSSSAYC